MRETRVYLVGDGSTLGSLRTERLRADGFEVAVCTSISQARRTEGSRLCAVLPCSSQQDGAAAIREARDDWEATVIAVVPDGDAAAARLALQAGATDVLFDASERDQWEQRIAQALDRDTVRARRRIRRKLILKRIASLTPREREVFALVVAGKANKVIAADLGVSIKTVEVHRARVMRKMNAPSLADLVEQALVSGFRECPC